MLHIRVQVFGLKESKTALANLERQIVQNIRKSTKNIAQIGKKEMQNIIRPFNWAGNTLYNSITIEDPTKYRTLLIVSAPHALAMDVGDVKLLPNFSSLEQVQTKHGTRYEWKGLDALLWKKEHYPHAKGNRVLVGKSGERDTPDGLPFTEGLHFSDIAMEKMEKSITNEIFTAISKIKF